MQSYYVANKADVDGFFCALCMRKELAMEEHYHSSAEIVYVLDGYAEARIRGENYHLTEGDLCFVLPYEDHSFSVEEHCTCYTMVLTTDYFEVFLPTVQGMNFTTNHIKIVKHTDLIEQCFRRLLSPIHPLEKKGCIQVILGHLLVAVSVTLEESKSPDQDIVKRMVKFFAANYQREFTVVEMAKGINCSVSNLSSILKRTFHCGFREYLNSLRIRHAKQLLAQSQATVLQVALDSGFSSLRSFNRIFKQHTGMSPSEYRQTLKGSADEQSIEILPVSEKPEEANFQENVKNG